MSSVRLDTQGRVVAVASGPAHRKGWIDAPPVADPWRLMLRDGEWIEMTTDAASRRDRDHAPPPPAVPAARQRLHKLKGRSPHNLSQGELAQAVLDLIDTL